MFCPGCEDFDPINKKKVQVNTLCLCPYRIREVSTHTYTHITTDKNLCVWVARGLGVFVGVGYMYVRVWAGAHV